MELNNKLNEIAQKITTQRGHILTEQATKTAFIMPFISALGYDVFNAVEVIPEFNAVFGSRKGTKVDYAISIDNRVLIVIEAKMIGAKLDAKHEAQLLFYFNASDAKIAILTDGVKYKFYTDLDEPNKMDTKPFLEFDILSLNNNILTEIKRFRKHNFNINEILTSASELKYINEIKSYISELIVNPDEEFLNIIIKKIYNGAKRAAVKEQFRPLLIKAFTQYISEQMTDVEQIKTLPKIETSNKKEIITTQDELEGFYYVKTLLSESINPERITYRDTLSYFGILLDDNNRQPICRLHFNEGKKYLEVFVNADKKSEKITLNSIDEIYKHKTKIINSAFIYLKGLPNVQTEPIMKTIVVKPLFSD